MPVCSLIVTTCLIGLSAEEGSRSEAVRKLVQAAWQAPPRRFDVVVYMERTEPPTIAPEQAKAMMEWVYSDWPGGRAAREEFVELGVQQVMAEQGRPSRFVKRVRTDGQRYRSDLKRLRAGEVPGNEVQLTETLVCRDDAAEGEPKVFLYSGETRSADIRRDDERWHRLDLSEWFGLPKGVKLIVQATLGRLSETRVIVPDEAKIQAFLSRGGSTWDLEVTSDGASRRHSVTLREPAGDRRVLVRLVCDEREYSRVYRAETYSSLTGRLVAIQELDGFDANGMPGYVRKEIYDADGNPQTVEVVYILKADLDPKLPEELFQFRPPPGYGAWDDRQSPPRELSAKTFPLVPPVGETLGEILGSDAEGALRRIKLREVKIELPTSRPTTQSATK